MWDVAAAGSYDGWVCRLAAALLVHCQDPSLQVGPAAAGSAATWPLLHSALQRMLTELWHQAVSGADTLQGNAVPDSPRRQ